MAIYPGYGFAPENVASFPVVNGTLSIEEGLALTFKFPLEDGVAKVKVGSTASTDKFAGFAYNQYRILPTSLPKVEEAIVPASTQTVVLSRDPVTPASQMKVVVTSAAGASTALSYNASAVSPTAFTVAGRVVTVDSSFNNYAIQITYNYTPSAIEARNFYGDARPGANNTGVMGVISVIKKGIVVITNYDTGADWSANTPIQVDSTGKLVKSGSGVTISNAIVKQVPSVQVPYLTIELL
jgi:hypothetical protein